MSTISSISSTSSVATTTASDISATLEIFPKISQKLCDETDYPAWVVEAKRQLWRMKLTSVVTGSEQEEPSTDSTDIEIWKDKTYRALEYLMDSCELGPQVKIRAAASAAQAWKILKDSYEGQTQIPTPALLLNVLNLRYDDRKSTLQEHVSMFEMNWLKLAQSATIGATGSLATDIKGFSQSDSWKGFIFLATLPKIQPYSTFVDNVDWQGDEPTYASIITRFKEIPLRKRQPGSNSERSENSKPPPAFLSTSSRLRCEYCKSKGWAGITHDEKDCWTKKRNLKKITAQAQTKEQSSAQTNTAHDDEWPNWAFASYTDNQRTTDWWADSCVSIHITNNLSDINDPKPYVETVNTRGGPVRCTHKGTATIEGIILDPILFIPNFPRKLISIASLTGKGAMMTLGGASESLKYQGKEFDLERQGNLYRLKL